MTLPTAKLTEWLRSQGRHGDTMLAHINPEEAYLLKQLGGSGTINPDTGLREYFGDASDHDSNSGNTGAESDNSSGGDRGGNGGGGGFAGYDGPEPSDYGPGYGGNPEATSENQRAAVRERRTNRAVVTDSYGRPVHSDFSSSGFVDSETAIGPNGSTGFSGYAPSSTDYAASRPDNIGLMMDDPVGLTFNPVANALSFEPTYSSNPMDYGFISDTFGDERDPTGVSDPDNPLGEYASVETPADLARNAMNAYDESQNTISDTIADFVMGPNDMAFTADGYPIAAAHDYSFFDSGLTQAFAGALSPALGGLYSVGKSIANNNPAELAFGVLGGMAAPFSPVDLATKAGSYFGVGDNMSFRDLSPSSISDSLSGFDLASLGEDITGMFAGLDTSTGASLTGGSANDTFGGGATNYNTPAPSLGGDTGIGVHPLAAQNLFTMGGEQLAQQNPYWYGGKRFFDDGDVVDIGDNYGLA